MADFFELGPEKMWSISCMQRTIVKRSDFTSRGNLFLGKLKLKKLSFMFKLRTGNVRNFLKKKSISEIFFVLKRFFFQFFSLSDIETNRKKTFETQKIF